MKINVILIVPKVGCQFLFSLWFNRALLMIRKINQSKFEMNFDAKTFHRSSK